MQVRPESGRHVRVLIVEADRRLIEDLRDMFTRNELECEVALDLATARGILAERRMDLALVDASLPDVNGVEVIREFKENYPCMNLVLFNGVSKKTEQRRMRRLGADSYLSKTSDLKAVLRASLRNLQR